MQFAFWHKSVCPPSTFEAHTLPSIVSHAQPVQTSWEKALPLIPLDHSADRFPLMVTPAC